MVQRWSDSAGAWARIFASKAAVDTAKLEGVNPATYRYATWIDQAGQSAYHWTNVLYPEGLRPRERDLMLAVVLYALLATAILLVWPGGIATRNVGIPS